VATYAIGYDLHPSKGETYGELIEAIKQVGSTWWHHLDSTWVVVSTKTAKQVRDFLAPHLKSDDQLLVVRLAGEGAWRGFDDNGSKWLKENL
jgi:hypothetical protein